MHRHFPTLQLIDYSVIRAVWAHANIVEGVGFENLLNVFLLLHRLLLILNRSLMLALEHLTLEHGVVDVAALRDFILHLYELLVHLHGIHVAESGLA